MEKKICYKTENLLALIPNYEFKSIKTYYYHEDGDYNKEEFYLVNSRYKIEKIEISYGIFGPSVYVDFVDFKDNSCNHIQLFYDNVNSNDNTLIRIHNNSIISPKLISSDSYIEATESLVEWLKNLGVSEDSLNELGEEFEIYHTIEYVGVPNVYVKNGYTVSSSENLVLNEKDINTVLNGIEDKNLRIKIEEILYARVFKRWY